MFQRASDLLLEFITRAQNEIEIEIKKKDIN